MNTGTIVEVIGPVLDVEVPRAAADYLQRPEIQVTPGRRDQQPGWSLEVQQHLGDNKVRAVALDNTDGIARGLEVVDTGDGISVPVGNATLGRLFNVIGEADR